MSDPILAIAVCVRKSAEREFPDGYWPRLRGCCMPVSYAFSFLLRGVGIKSAIIQGKYAGEPHVWVWRGTKLYDLTLTQFEPDAPPVAVLLANHPSYEPLSPLTENDVREHLFECGLDEHVVSLVRRSVELVGALHKSLALEWADPSDATCVTIRPAAEFHPEPPC